MGLVRYIGASFHDLNLAQQWLNSPLLDVVMVRHNVAHRSAQGQVFNQLNAQDSDRSGVVTFKSTGSHSGMLWNPPMGLPQGCWRPSVPDLYRYSLTQNCVDVCLMGLSRREEIDAAIAGVQKGKLTTAEIDYLISNPVNCTHLEQCLRPPVKLGESTNQRWLFEQSSTTLK